MLYADENSTNRQEPRALQDSYLDFLLSRQAMLCTEQTLAFYKKTLGKFVEWLEQKGVNEPTEISSRHVRAYLAGKEERGCADSYIHTFARSIRTYLRFLHEERYTQETVTFQMPRIGQKRLPVLSVDEVNRALNSCHCVRDKAIFLFLVDTGLRRGEVCSLNWGDVDIASGLCIVQRGKGKKTRSVVIGVHTRRVLLKYRLRVSYKDYDPLFQTQDGKRLTPGGLRSLFVRLSEQTGIHITPHALRRTFVTLSLKSGMSLAHVQALMGHSTPTMTLEYARLVDDDLLIAHQQHGPVDSMLLR